MDIDTTEFSEKSRSKAQKFVELGLTPTEYFLRELEQNDGRLSQKQLVEATELSAATVSRKLSAMEADGQIERIQLGRQKTVFLPENRPTEFPRIEDAHGAVDSENDSQSSA